MSSLKLAKTVHTVFGLAFDVEKSNTTKSGFKPAAIDLGGGKALFGDLRLEGFAAGLQTGFARRLIIFGGDEGRYKGETPLVNRAEQIARMLIMDTGISKGWIDYIDHIPSRSNTGGNIVAMKELMQSEGLGVDDCAVVTSHYHIPRAQLDLLAADLPLPMYAAESLLLLGGLSKNELMLRLGGGSLSERVAEEVQGIADKVRGTYTPRTDESSRR